MRKKTLSALLATLFASATLCATDVGLRLSILDEKIAAPLINSVVDMNLRPGVLVGVEWYFVRSKEISVYQPMSLFAYYHPSSFQGSSFGGTTGIALETNWDLFYGKYKIEAGYVHTFSTLPGFIWDDVSKTWRGDLLGRPNLLAGGTLGFGVSLEKSGLPIKIDLAYSLNVYYNMSPTGYSAILPVSMVLVGTTLLLGESK